MFAGDKQVGNLYDWFFEGVNGDWTATAKKYRIEQEGELEFRFYTKAKKREDEVELIGIGSVESATADGVVHRESVRVKGTTAWVQPASEST